MAKKKAVKAKKKPAPEMMTWEQASELGLPDADQLATLPRRSIVAYAVRCALRVQPKVRNDHGTIVAVHRAIELAANYVRGLPVSVKDLNAVADRLKSYRAAIARLPPGAAARVNAVRAAARAAARAATPPNSNRASHALGAANNAINAAPDSDYVLRVNAASRLDFEMLKRRGGKPENIGRTVNPYDGESLGDLWHGHAPDGYAEAKAKLDQQLRLTSRKVALPAKTKSASTKQKELQQRIKKLEQDLNTAHQDLNSAHQEIERRPENPEYEKMAEEVNQLQETASKLEAEKETLSKELAAHATAEAEARKRSQEELTFANGVIEELKSDLDIAEKKTKDAQHRESHAVKEQEAAQAEALAARTESQETQKELRDTRYLLDDARWKLSLLEPLTISEVWEKLKSPRVITAIFAWIFMVAAVITLTLATSEIQKRQQLTKIIDSRIDETQQDLVSESECLPDCEPAENIPATKNAPDDEDSDIGNQMAAEDASSKIQPRSDTVSLKEQLKQLKRIRSDIHVLVATGTQRTSQSLDGIRNRLLNLEAGAVSEYENAGIGVLPGYSSDLLLSVIVILAGAVGAVIAAMRSGDLFTFSDLGLGLAAGLITFLVIRSGRSIFIMQANGVTFVLNPYTSAFFGLAAGIFTDRAYRLLMAVITKLIEKIRDAFELDPAELEEPGKSKMTKPDSPPVKPETDEPPASDENTSRDQPPDEPDS